jgi:hypothetical protein
MNPLSFFFTCRGKTPYQNMDSLPLFKLNINYRGRHHRCMYFLRYMRLITPVLSHIPVILTDTLNNVAYSYPSIASALKALDVPTSTRSSNIRSRYMDTGLLYKEL